MTPSENCGPDIYATTNVGGSPGAPAVPVASAVAITLASICAVFAVLPTTTLPKKFDALIVVLLYVEFNLT